MLRPYHARDLDGVLAAWAAANVVAHPFLSEVFVEQVRHDIPNLYLPNAETFVWEVDGRIAGFIALLGNEVGAIFVDPEMQGQGIGRALMDHARELRGELELEVFEANSIGRRFYDRYGFELLRETIHEPTGHPLLRLRLAATGAGRSESGPRVSLRELTAETFGAVCKLDVAEHQRGFVAPNAVSMAQAGFYQEAWFRGIYAGDEPVGFVMLSDDTLKDTPPAEPTAFVWRFMIDARRQGQGLGRAALELVIEHVRAKGFPCLQLSYVEGPGCPERFYLRAGFEHTGKLEEGERVLELRFDGEPVERVDGDAAGGAGAG